MRIKITGYLDTNDLDPEDLDLNHPSGLSDAAYASLAAGQGVGHFQGGKSLDDVEVELEA